MTVVIGTAGHIDHGKTTLLRALTGIDADRLPEERARGMTIDVGYAHLVLDDGTEIDFVDVPGHDRLVGNMLVGAGEIDAALIVVAGDDGPRAQTFEHLLLLDALGIGDGVAVVTKADVADPARVAAVVAETRELLAGTTLAGVPVLAVSATTGDGIPALRESLIGLRDRLQRAAVPGAGVGGPPGPGSRLAIDRVFAVRGRGTVVTGTLRGAPIGTGTHLRVVPSEDAADVRIREVQVHGRRVESAGTGRAALNVAGTGVAGLVRGSVLATDPAVVATDRALVVLRPGPRLGAAGEAGPGSIPRDRSRVVLHAGTDHVGATVGRGGREGIELPTGEAVMILRLDRPIAAAPGDRFVLRTGAAPPIGGRVIDPNPPHGIARRRATAARIAALADAEPATAAWTAARLELHGATVEPPALAADVAEAVDAAILVTVSDAEDEVRRNAVLRTGASVLRRLVGRIGEPAGRVRPDGGVELASARLDALISAGRLVADGDRLRLPGAAPRGPSGELLAAMDRLVERLAVVAPPPLLVTAREVGCPPAGIRELERSNRIVRLDDDLAWAFETYRDLAARALAMAAERPLTPAAYRDATGTSRKYVMAILADLDRRAVLRRTPAGHLPGPRAPRPAHDPAAVATAGRAADTGAR